MPCIRDARTTNENWRYWALRNKSNLWKPKTKTCGIGPPFSRASFKRHTSLFNYTQGGFGSRRPARIFNYGHVHEKLYLPRKRHAPRNPTGLTVVRRYVGRHDLWIIPGAVKSISITPIRTDLYGVHPLSPCIRFPIVPIASSQLSKTWT